MSRVWVAVIWAVMGAAGLALLPGSGAAEKPSKLKKLIESRGAELGLPEGSGDEAGPQSSSAAPGKKFPGYGNYAKYFYVLCDKISADGRGPLLFRIMNSQDRKYDYCPACRAFYKMVARGCKPKIVKVKKGDPTPVPLQLQRDQSGEKIRSDLIPPPIIP